MKRFFSVLCALLLCLPALFAVSAETAKSAGRHRRSAHRTEKKRFMGEPPCYSSSWMGALRVRERVRFPLRQRSSSRKAFSCLGSLSTTV